MCDEKIQQAILHEVRRRGPIDTTYNVTTTSPLIIDYKERRHLFIFSHDNVVLQAEDIGSVYIPSGIWTQLEFDTGTRLTPSNAAVILARATDDLIIPAPNVPFVGAALAPYSQNATQTAAAAADTPYQFGLSGAARGNHCSLQNNNTINVQYAFDQDSTKAGNQIYILAPGQLVFWDRSFAVLHFSSAAQINFGGTSGITVEAYS